MNFTQLIFSFMFLGKSEPELSWNDGRLAMKYTGERCNNSTNYTLQLILQCDYSGDVHNNVGVFSHEESCDKLILMHVKEACLPKPESFVNTKCFLNTKSGKTINFHKLRNENFETAMTHDRVKFIIGVCDPVLYGHESACEAGTTVCQVDTKATGADRYKNIGSMTRDFYEEAGDVILTLSSQEICKSNTSKKLETHIIFTCDPLEKTGSPVYAGMTDCVHIFIWSTSQACAIEEKSTSCSAMNPQTGESYDFTSLAGTQFEAVNKNNSEEKILFSICSEAKQPCIQGAGSCILKTRNNSTTQAGVSNSNLKMEGNNVYLKYESGSICQKQGQYYSTKIYFICADDAQDEGAVAIEDGCDIVIHYKTLLACTKQKFCRAQRMDGRQFDLSPLIDYDGNYVATVNKDNLPKEASEQIQYVLNVCRPLNSIYSLNCRGSSGACRTILDKNGKHENEMSLGHSDFILQATRDDKVIMKYFDGALCPTDSSENITTKITFFCDEKAGYGQPLLQSISQCEYRFDFATGILCDEQLLSISDNCSLVNSKTSVSLDMKLLGDDGVYNVNGNKIDICGTNENKFHTIVYSQSLVRIEFPYKKDNGGEDEDAIAFMSGVNLIFQTDIRFPIFRYR